jgi:hypothetical protein
MSPSSGKDRTTKRPKSKNVDTGAPFLSALNVLLRVSIIVEIRLRNKMQPIVDSVSVPHRQTFSITLLKSLICILLRVYGS